MIMTIWKDFGYAVVMYMAGLYSLPADALEAAKVDGANAWQTFKYITFPLLKPMTMFVTITSIISYIQAYVQILIMTEGGPGTATYLSSYIIYDEAFVKYNFGYASALSFVLFVITAFFTWLSFRVSGSESRRERHDKKNKQNRIEFNPAAAWCRYSLSICLDACVFI